MQDPTPPQELGAIIGQHLIYTYANGWQYELYVKNAATIDYRIHSGMVGGRWVKGQAVHLVQVATGVYKISWTEPTGTSVSLTVNPGDRWLHGTAVFPRWVELDPQQTVCFQNDHLDRMRSLRDAGPTYPLFVVDEFARVTFAEQVSADDDTVINCPPAELPVGYATRTTVG